MNKTCFASLAIVWIFPVLCFGGLTTVFDADITMLMGFSSAVFVACSQILTATHYSKKRAGYVVTVLSGVVFTALTLGYVLSNGFEHAVNTSPYFLLILTVPLGTISGAATYIGGRSVIAYLVFGWTLTCVTSGSFWMWGQYYDLLAFIIYGLTATTIVGSIKFYETLNAEAFDDKEDDDDNYKTNQNLFKASPLWIGAIISGLSGLILTTCCVILFDDHYTTLVTPMFLPFYVTGAVLGTVALYPAIRKYHDWIDAVFVVSVFLINVAMTLAAAFNVELIRKLTGTNLYASSVIGIVKGFVDALTIYGLTKTTFTLYPFILWYSVVIGLNCYVILSIEEHLATLFL